MRTRTSRRPRQRSATVTSLPMAARSSSSARPWHGSTCSPAPRRSRTLSRPSPARMSAGGALGASLLAVLVHPRWWILALAGFLVRGGLLLLFLPLVQLPTTAGLANALGPTLVGFVFGGPSPSFLLLVGTIVGGLALWLGPGGLAGAAPDPHLRPPGRPHQAP